MKTISKLLLIISFLTIHSFAMDEKGWSSTYESISAFDKSNPLYGNRPGYVKPIITNLSTILNSNWASSSSIPQSFTFEAGMPFTIVPINNSDREYGNNNPTIFGGNDKNNAYRIATDVCSPEAIAQYGGCSVVNGNENLNALNVFTYPYIQLAGSFYHTRIILRGMYLPPISQLRKFNLFGFGMQYSFGHFFRHLLPSMAQPFDISLLFGYSQSNIGYNPDEFKGTLNLDISAYTIDFVLGYKPFSFIEAMLSLGYQYASMKSSGHLVNETNLLSQINPNLTVKGDNGFRFGIEVAFQFGTYHPVVGYNYIGKTSFTTNLLYFKQTLGKDKSPAEISKEKEITSNANNKEDDSIKDANTSKSVSEEINQEPNKENEISNDESQEESNSTSTDDSLKNSDDENFN